ncbi:MAG: glycosyltransferase family 2 protein [Candidatus Rokubacteria bacterium]|nr:glycosyltransferase family 2 protein [Candidatus Rokubacteria bacterium]
MNPIVLIPALNEAASIARVVGAIRTAVPGVPVVVVDDGSTDGTASIARAAGARVVRLPFNMGYGVALQTGYKYALRHGHDCVVQLDGDGQHEPADIPALVEAIAGGGADVALGSRFLGKDDYRPDLIRRIGMQLFSRLAFLLGGTRLTDVTSGFQALSGDVVRFLAADRYPSDYPDADVLLMLQRSRFRIQEVPVRMYGRRGGRSMHSGLRPVYYAFKMLLSVSLTSLRREGFDRTEA